MRRLIKWKGESDRVERRGNEENVVLDKSVCLQVHEMPYIGMIRYDKCSDCASW